MLIRTGRDGYQHPIASEITAQAVYQDRRQLLKWMATGVAGAALASWAQREAFAQQVQRPGKLAAINSVRSTVPGAVTM
jgi:sulfoxide reductase catalytic subunit YedY